MIQTTLPGQRTGYMTLDQILRQNAQRFGDAQALVDAPDRPLWADGAPRRLNWAQIDAAVSGVAGRFLETGLPSDSVVCIQGLNISDTLIALLGCIRAGLVAAMVPPGFDAAETVALAECLNAKAILSAYQIGPEQPLRALRHLINESVVDIRFVGAFGADLPGGIISFEDCIAFPQGGSLARLSRRADPLDNPVVITIDGTPGRYFAVARSHRELLTAGALVTAGLHLHGNSRLLSAMMPVRLAGLASGLVPWLMSANLLVLHQPFDTMVLGVQLGMHAITHVAMPDVALQAAMAETVLSGRKLEAVAGLTREPHRFFKLPDQGFLTPYFAVLGEIGLMPGAVLPNGRLKLPRQIAMGDGLPPAFETSLCEEGYLALRGGEVPGTSLTPDGAFAAYPVDDDGWVATHYPALSVEDGLFVTGKRFSAPAVESFSAEENESAATEAAADMGPYLKPAQSAVSAL